MKHWSWSWPAGSSVGMWGSARAILPPATNQDLSKPFKTSRHSEHLSHSKAGSSVKSKDGSQLLLYSQHVDTVVLSVVLDTWVSLQQIFWMANYTRVVWLPLSGGSLWKSLTTFQSLQSGVLWSSSMNPCKLVTKIILADLPRLPVVWLCNEQQTYIVHINIWIYQIQIQYIYTYTPCNVHFLLSYEIGFKT